MTLPMRCFLFRLRRAEALLIVAYVQIPRPVSWAFCYLTVINMFNSSVGIQPINNENRCKYKTVIFSTREAEAGFYSVFLFV